MMTEQTVESKRQPVDYMTYDGSSARNRDSRTRGDLGSGYGDRLCTLLRRLPIFAVSPTPTTSKDKSRDNGR